MIFFSFIDFTIYFASLFAQTEENVSPALKFLSYLRFD